MRRCRIAGLRLFAVFLCCSLSGAHEVAAAALPNPLLFVTQVPPGGTFDAVTAVFNNHRPSINSAPRGGDLWILYPDGELKNLTAAAGYGVAAGHMQSPGDSQALDFPYASDPQGQAGGIAVRDPEVHWSGNKAIFSMVVGSPARYQIPEFRWQLFEISGLGKNDTPVITRIPQQPPYNNIQPIYASDERIIFVSDRPRGGQAHLYPQRDEYESTPIVTGLYALDRSSGALETLTHSPSGDFNPILAADGRIIFTRWDHLIRDQQADADLFNGASFGAMTYANERDDAARMTLSAFDEVFPEPRQQAYLDVLFPGSNQNPHPMNFFFPWQINQDGSEVLTLNHVGRHELIGFFERAFKDDPALQDFNFQAPLRGNQHTLRDAFTHPREDPNQSGRFVAVMSSEFATQAGGQVVAFENAALDQHAGQFRTVPLTPATTFGFRDEGQPERVGDSGRYRNPLLLSDGQLVASHSAETRVDADEGSTGNSLFEGQMVPTQYPQRRYGFRLRLLQASGDGFMQASATALTGAGIRKTLSYFSPDQLIVQQDVQLWELDPVEVRARPAPPATQRPALQAPELSAFADAGVDPQQFRAWLKEQGLAALVVRNMTSRDSADRQQPFNLQVPGGVKTTATNSSGKLYDISAWQLFQGDQVRGYGGVAQPSAGRRVLARPLHEAPNPPSSAPAGAVPIEADGSAAALVPAGRALTSQLLAPAGDAVVRERIWFSAVPGEVRVCASCHGLNSSDQAGNSAPTNTPLALEKLLLWWKAEQANLPFFRDGFEAGG